MNCPVLASSAIPNPLDSAVVRRANSKSCSRRSISLTCVYRTPTWIPNGEPSNVGNVPVSVARPAISCRAWFARSTEVVTLRQQIGGCDGLVARGAIEEGVGSVPLQLVIGNYEVIAGTGADKHSVLIGAKPTARAKCAADNIEITNPRGYANSGTSIAGHLTADQGIIRTIREIEPGSSIAKYVAINELNTRHRSSLWIVNSNAIDATSGKPAANEPTAQYSPSPGAIYQHAILAALIEEAVSTIYGRNGLPGLRIHQ